MKYLYILFIFCTLSVSAQKWDYQWIFGYGQQSTLPGFGISVLDFNDDLVTISKSDLDFEYYDIDNGGSFICDENGQVMLSSNNCSIRNAAYEIIENGDEINPGYNFDTYCHDGDYPANKSNLILPSLHNDTTFFVVHKDSGWDSNLNTVHSFKLYLSKVIKRIDGSFYRKESNLLLEQTITGWNMACTINPLDNSWWVYVRKWNSNKLYKFKIGSLDTDYEGPDLIQTGPVITNFNSGFQMTFSPDGTMMAADNAEHGVVLYDFDMATGDLVHRENISFPNMDNSGACMFSPNSRFVYLTGHRCVYQMDLDHIDEEGFIVQLDSIAASDPTGWPIGSGQIYPGPDCRLYVSPGSTTFSIHVIHEPDEKAPNCNYERNGIISPSRLLHYLPNMPTYRMQGMCNYDIEWGIINAIDNLPNLVGAMAVSPNPASDFVEFSIVDEEANALLGYDYSLYNIAGQLVDAQKVRFGLNSWRYPVADLVNGLYLYSFVSSKGREYKGRFVVVH